MFGNKSQNENLPEAWKKYNACFNHTPISINETRFVAFDIETTGLDVKKNEIISIGAIAFNSRAIHVKEAFEIYIQPKTYNPNTAEIHGLISKEDNAFDNIEEALYHFLDFIKNSVLVAHHKGFDLGFINKALKEIGLPKLKNKCLDTNYLYKKTIHKVNIIHPDKNYTLDELCAALDLPTEDRHTAAGDAYITALAFLKIFSKLNKLKNLSLSKLKQYGS